METYQVDYDYEKEQIGKAVSYLDKRRLPSLREAVKQLLQDVPKDSYICDAGCRNGTGLLAMKELGYTNIIGVDLVSSNIVACKLNGVTAIQGDIHNLEDLFPCDNFDCILLVHTLEHLKNPRKGLLSLRNILKTNGRLLVITPKAHKTTKFHYYFWDTVDLLKEFVTSCGFICTSEEKLDSMQGPELWVMAIK